ncbi:MAG: HD domain-containing protein [bacterium]|nr:HD domain-containing protein [bacterium]
MTTNERVSSKESFTEQSRPGLWRVFRNIRTLGESQTLSLKYDESDYRSKYETLRVRYVGEQYAFVGEIEKKIDAYFKTVPERDYVKFALMYVIDNMSVLKLRDGGTLPAEHCVACATILLDEIPVILPPEIVVAALAHDLTEDVVKGETSDGREIILSDIERDLGYRVAVLVDGVSLLKGDKLKLLPESEQDAIAIEQVLRSMSYDPGIVLIKGADRLHNMRNQWEVKAKLNDDDSIKVTKENRQRNKALETEKYVKFFRRMGIFSDELARLCLLYIDAASHNKITRLLKENNFSTSIVENEFARVLERVNYGNEYRIMGRNQLRFFRRLWLTNVDKIPRFSVRRPDYLEIHEQVLLGQSYEEAVGPIISIGCKSHREIDTIIERLERYNANDDAIHPDFSQMLEVKTVSPSEKRISGFQLSAGLCARINVYLANEGLGRIYLPDLVRRDQNFSSLNHIYSSLKFFGNYMNKRLGESSEQRVESIVSEMSEGSITVWIRSTLEGSKEKDKYRAVVLPKGATVWDAVCRLNDPRDVALIRAMFVDKEKYTGTMDLLETPYYELPIAHGSYLSLSLGTAERFSFKPSNHSFQNLQTEPARDSARVRIQYWMNEDPAYRENMHEYLLNEGRALIHEYLLNKYNYLREVEPLIITKFIDSLGLVEGHSAEAYFKGAALVPSTKRAEYLLQLDKELESRAFFIDRSVPLVDSPPTDRMYYSLRELISSPNVQGTLFGFRLDDGSQLSIKAIILLPFGQEGHARQRVKELVSML